jgi:hypothetical protein
MADNLPDLDVMEDLEPSHTTTNKKSHPWRICPIGKHYVRTHSLHIPPSKEHPQGQIVTRHEHCADNPSHKDMLSCDEIQAIAKAQFSNLVGPPFAKILTEFPDADKFDQEIRGWARYWNEVFDPKEPLDPNLVKALIASESSFKPNQNISTGNKKLGRARGLMQLTDKTIQIIGDHKGELKNHFIHLTHNDALDPSANICAGVRWLFRKQVIATERLHHVATWDNAVAEYKGVLKGIITNKNPDPKNEMLKFRSFYNQLLEHTQNETTSYNNLGTSIDHSTQSKCH